MCLHFCRGNSGIHWSLKHSGTQWSLAGSYNGRSSHHLCRNLHLGTDLMAQKDRTILVKCRKCTRTWYCVWRWQTIIVIQHVKFTWPLTRSTVIDICFTGQPSISSSAGAQEASKFVSAGPTVLAGVWDAFIHIYVTQLTWRMQKKGMITFNSRS